jgi:hypothetical protein
MDITTIASITQTRKNPHTTSDKYAFIPTTRALGVLAGHGWHPVKASEARVLKEENQGYQRHMIRLRNDQFARGLDVGDVLPEIVLVNSHGGGSSFQLYAALLEKVCTNGLIVERGTAAHYRIAHTGYADAKVDVAVGDLAGYFPDILARRDAMREFLLNPAGQLAVARAAAVLRFGDRPHPVNPEVLLTVRHAGQAAPTLWNTINVVQENAIRGGLRTYLPGGRRSRTRPVNGIADSVRLNRALWRLAEDAADGRP